MKILALPAFNDNYIWMLHDGDNAVVVDPGDASVVEAALAGASLKLRGILVTHHHPDHIGGVDALREHWQVPVYGPARERIPQPFVALLEGDSVALLGHSFEVLDVPGHTAGHIAYVMRRAGQDAALFCGDTLFSAGCGRLFEGTPEQMHASLSKLAALPAQTQVYCTHEYTLSNLRFAQAVEPGNAEVLQALARCGALREQGQITLPSTVAQERAINPFLRCAEPAVVAQALGQGATESSEVAVFAALREWKNRF
jgi:hydroxyacylglutathione hydrolase